MTETTVTIERKFSDPLFGTIVKVGDVELPNLVNVEFRHKARELAEVKVDMVAMGDFNITLPANVSVTITMTPGHILSKVHEPDGSISYRCVEGVRS